MKETETINCSLLSMCITRLAVRPSLPSRVVHGAVSYENKNYQSVSENYIDIVS